MAFSPDNSRLAITGLNRQVQVFDAPNGEALFVLAEHTRFSECLAFNPTGKQLASGAFDGTVKIWSLDSLSGSFIENCSVSIASRSVTMGARGSRRRVVDLGRIFSRSGIHKMGRYSLSARQLTSELAAVAFSPDGQGGCIRRWRPYDQAMGSAECRDLVYHSAPSHRPRRVRLRARRRHCPRFDGARWRRTGHRKVDDPPAGGGTG